MSTVVEEDAIALRKVRFSESSLIVTWLGSRSGKIKTSVRGALKPGGAFAGRVDLFHETRICWTPPRRGDVATLTEAEIRRAFLPSGAAAGFRNFQHAAYFCELIEMASPPAEPVPDLFDLLRRALGYLLENPVAPGALDRFEMRVVRLLGIAPEDDTRPAARVLEDYIGHLPAARSPISG